MKKFLLAVLAGVMVVGFATQAMAEITIGGSIETRYAAWHNMTLNHGLAGDADMKSGSQTFWDSNIKLHVDAKITEGLEAFIELEQDNTPWGNSSNPRRFFNHYVNEDDYFFADAGPYSSEDRKDPRLNGIGLRQAWINFTIPGTPVGMKIGHQPLALGHGIWLDLHRYGADSILLYSKPIPELLVAAAYAKGLESSPVTPLNRNFALAKHPAGPYWNAQPGGTTNEHSPIAGAGSDFDFWAVLAAYTFMENNTASINLSYAHDNSKWIDTFFDGVTGPAVNAVSGDQLGSANIRAFNVGVTADGNIAGLNYKAEVDYLHVNVDNFGNVLGAFSGTNGSYVVTAWAAMAGANMNIANVVDLGVEAAYGSGNRTGDPAVIYGLLGGPAYGTFLDDTAKTGRHDHAYATPYQLTSYNYAYIYNDKVGQGPFGVGGGKGFGDGYGGFGLANTTYVKMSLGAAPMERMTAGMDIIWLRASNSIIRGQSRSLGWEIDGHVAYNLYDNLKLEVMGGYFFTGPFYAYNGHNDITPAFGTNLATSLAGFSDRITDDGLATGNLKRDDAFGAEARLTVEF